MDLTTAALLSAMLRAGSGSLQDPIHEEVLNAIRKRKDGMLAAAKLQSFCEKHDKDSLPRVRFWVRAFEALGDCKTASDVNALFASNLTNYVRDYLDRQETRSVNAMRNLFYGSCAITCFGFATQKAFDDAAAEVKAAAAAATAAATSKVYHFFFSLDGCIRRAKFDCCSGGQCELGVCHAQSCRCCARCRLSQRRFRLGPILGDCARGGRELPRGRRRERYVRHVGAAVLARLRGRR